MLQILNNALLLRVLLHQRRRLLLKLLIDRQVLPPVGQPLILLVLRKQVVFDLDERIVANFLKLSPEVVVLLLEVLYVFVFHGDRAAQPRQLLLKLRDLLPIVLFYALNFVLFFS